MLIVFFDGYCGLCSGTVDFLIKRDTKRKLRYSPLQGETAKLKLTTSEIEDLDTVIVFRETNEPTTTEKLRKSAAILAALKELGGVYAVIAAALSIFPKYFSDTIYDLIAKNRFKLFGRRDSCRAPTKEERELFLP